MKKLLFQKFLKDTLKSLFFLLLSTSLIVWVIQAVNFLDFVSEDGHSLYVYFSYTLLNFPKIVHRIFPFVFFISLFYQILKYEQKNELLIFWTYGVKKIEFLNVVILYSLVVTFFLIFLGSIVSPISQDKARNYIRNSNIDFFPSLIKEGKFIDTVSGLTIFIESKNKLGIYNNIFLNENLDGEVTDSQIIYAKTGRLVNDGKNKFFELLDGRIINNSKKEMQNFQFEKIDFNLDKYSSKSTSYPKIQESSNLDMIRCIYHSYKKTLEIFRAEYLRCNEVTLKPIQEELLKRFFKPIYLPLLALLCCSLILESKESRSYEKFKLILFFIIFLILVISEISLRY